MKNIRIFMSAVLAAGLFLGITFAQTMGPAGGSPTPGIDPVMARLFGAIAGFSANAEMTVDGPQGPMSMDCSYEISGGKMRMEIDMASMKSALMPPEAVAQMKAMGMDRMVNISLPDRKQLFVIYPGLQSYIVMPLPQNAATGNAGNDATVVYTEIGKDTIDEHPCVKNKVTINAGDGQKREGVVWNATDMKGFPIRFKFDDPQAHMTMHFRNVKFQEPDASHFEPPASYTKYNSMQEMMQSVMQKLMERGGA